MSTIQEIGVEFIQYLQTFHPQLDGVMAFFAIFVKAEYFMVFILPFLYWNFGNRFFIKLIIFVLLDILIGEILRIALAQPRPWWIAEMIPIDAVTSVYSSPAGYSSFTTLFFGFLAYHFKKKIITFLCVFIIIATSIAKLYEAATLIDHLFLGILQGGILLWLFIKKSDFIVDWVISLNKNNVILLSIGTTIIFYGFTYLIANIQLSYELPQSMIKYKIIPIERLANGATVFGTGFLISSLLSLKFNLLNHTNAILKINIWRRIIGTIIGLIIVFGVFIILRTSLVNLFFNDLIVGVLNLTITIITGLWIYVWFPKLYYKK